MAWCTALTIASACGVGPEPGADPRIEVAVEDCRAMHGGRRELKLRFISAGDWRSAIPFEDWRVAGVLPLASEGVQMKFARPSPRAPAVTITLLPLESAARTLELRAVEFSVPSRIRLTTDEVAELEGASASSTLAALTVDHVTHAGDILDLVVSVDASGLPAGVALVGLVEPTITIDGLRVVAGSTVGNAISPDEWIGSVTFDLTKAVTPTPSVFEIGGVVVHSFPDPTYSISLPANC